MRLVSVSGIRGSGKTTLIRELIASLAVRGRRSALIVNEEGEENYTQDFLDAHGVGMAQLRGG
jgi:G3E family GTPase